MSAKEEPRPSDAQPPIIFRKKKPKSIRQRAAADPGSKGEREGAGNVRQKTNSTPAEEQEAPPSALAVLLEAVERKNEVLGPGDEKNTQEERAEEATPTGAGEDEEAPALAELLRQRRKQQHRPKGVEFRAERLSSRGNDEGDEKAVGRVNPESSLMVRSAGEEAQNAPVGGLLKRFAPQMGLRTDLVNRHM
jgi:hypothetical protein